MNAAVQEMSDLRSHNTLCLSALKDAGIEPPEKPLKSSIASTAAPDSAAAKDDVCLDSPRTMSLKRNGEMTMQALGYSAAPSWESMGISRSGRASAGGGAGQKFADSPYHPQHELANGLTLNGYEKTKSGKMVYEIESELQDTLRALHVSTDQAEVNQQQLEGLRRQLSEMHSTNKKLRNQMEAMLNSQGRVLTKATEVSSTMHLTDLKAFGQVLENLFSPLAPPPASAAASCCRPLDAPQLMQWNQARDELSALLVHPLQARSQQEQDAIEDLLAVYARVSVAVQQGGSQHIQQELNQYLNLEKQMVAEAHAAGRVEADGDFGTLFASLEKQLVDAQAELASDANKMQQLEDGYARSRREISKLKASSS